MQRARILALLVAASFSMLTVGVCADSSDLFLQGFQDFQTAEKMERESKPREALDKYRSALAVLERVTKEFPDWQPLVLEYRIKKTRDNIARLEPQVAAMPAPEVGPEGPLPESDRNRGGYSSSTPTVSSEPYPTTTPRSSSRRQSTTTRSTPSYPDLPTGGGVSSSRELRELRRQLEDLNNKYMARTAELQSARAEIDKMKVSVVEYKAQLAQANVTLSDLKKDESFGGAQRQSYESQIAELFQKLAEVRADNEVLTDENERLVGKLDLASKYIITSDTIRETLLKERKEIAAARDTAIARNKKIKDNAAEIEKVTAENKTLKGKIAVFEKGTVPKADNEKLAADKAKLDEEYAEARKKVEELSAAIPEKDKLITSLQSELNGVNDRLLEAQSQVSKNDDQVTSLQTQLDETAGELAKLKINGLPEREQQSLVAENELLRGIILRQIKEQTQRDDARKSMEQEIASLQIKSDVITQQLAVLGAPVLQLTAEEKTLFKEPVALLSEPSAQSLEVTMAVSKPDGVQPAAESQPEAEAAFPAAMREKAEQAGQLFGLKNYVEAEKLYQQIVEEVPDNYFALSNLGAVQIEAGKLSAAEVALTKAIEIKPGDSFAYRNLGIAYSRQGKFNDAVSQLRRALEISSTDAVAHNYLGVCLGQQDNPQEAERELKRAIDLKPDYPEAHFNLAVLYATVQPPSLDLAKIHYNRATELGAPPDPSLERLIQ